MDTRPLQWIASAWMLLASVAPTIGRADRDSDFPCPQPIDGLVTIAMRDAKPEDMIGFIAATTGKTVLFRLPPASRTMTVLHRDPLPPEEALQVLYKAFRLAGIGVQETFDAIVIDELDRLDDLQDEGVVLGPEEDVSQLASDGVLVTKVFAMREARAAAVAERLKDALPGFANVIVDERTNQIIVEGHVGLLQRVQKLVGALDRPSAAKVCTRTFNLLYADATEVMEMVIDLYGTDGAGQSQAQSPRPAPGQGRPGQPRPAPGAVGGATEMVGTSEQLRVVVQPQLNALTITAEPRVMEEIASLIEGAWDRAALDEHRIYSLRFRDPRDVAGIVAQLFGIPVDDVSADRTTVARGGGQREAGGSDVLPLADLRVTVVPDARQVVVASRAPGLLARIDALVAEIDRPMEADLPVVVELRYADAIELGQQLSALFTEGAEISLEGAEEGLSKGNAMRADMQSGSQGGSGAPALPSQTQGHDAAIDLPWQTPGARTGAEGQDSPVSPLVGKAHILPIVERNALAILATPDARAAILAMIEQLDRPGRQVLITAVIADVELRDQFAYGVRVSSSDIVPALPDNALKGIVGIGAGLDDFLPGFDTSVLDLGVNVNVLLQALDQKTNVRVLQRPRIFVANNEEGAVFIGQQIPYITNSFTSDLGGLNVGYEYQDVGVILNVRPSISASGEVAMEIGLTLSNDTGVVIAGGPVIDKRSTDTQVRVRDGQTIVISGLRYEVGGDVKRKLPLLGDIPGLGDLLFSSTEKSTTTKEMLAFVTPVVVNNPADNDDNFNQEDRRKLREIEAGDAASVLGSGAGANVDATASPAPGAAPSGAPDAAAGTPPGAGDERQRGSMGR